MSDSGPSTFAEASAGFEASLANEEAAPVETGVADQAPAQAEDAIAQAGASQGMSPGEVKALRDEAARYRTQLREEQNVWQGLHPDDAKFIRDTIALASTDPQAAAARWAQVTAAFAAPQAPPPQPQPMTRDDMEKFFADREKAEQEKQAVSAVVTEATGLGYVQGTPAYNQFLSYALDNHDGDLQAAHQAIVGAAEALKKQAVDEYVASKLGKASSSPTVAPQGGGSPDATSDVPKTIEEASARFRAMAQ